MGSASRLYPWTSLRRLAIRTQPSRPSRIPAGHVPAATRIAVLSGSRGLTGEASTDTPAEEYVLPRRDPFADNYMNAEAIAALEQAAAGQDALALAAGLKFGMPPRPGKFDKLQERHHPIIHQVTRMLMRDGQLSKAQKHLALILNFLRTSPTPKVSPLRPLLPGSPPPEQLPLNPLLYLTLAIDSVAPIVRVRSMKGAAGGGQALDVPEPISARARRRMAMLWIFDIVNKKRFPGSGTKQFATRFGQEIVAVIEGRSAVWERRQLVHRLGTAARANLMHPNVAGKKKK